MSALNLPCSDAATEILIVDDEPMLADLVSEWVEEKWACEVVYDGRQALEVVNERIDIVLLDRQMPGLSGEEVLARLRDLGYDIQVMFVSGVRPALDVLELPFDDYLRKPVDRPRLQAAIEQLLLRRTYHRDIQQFFVAKAKVELLEEVMPAEELAESEDYLALRTKADELRQAADATLGERTRYVEGSIDVQLDD